MPDKSPPRKPKPHVVFRNGRWQLFADRWDAARWPWPALQASTVPELSARLKAYRRSIPGLN